jgi:antirestriction protein ArdC
MKALRDHVIPVAKRFAAALDAGIAPWSRSERQGEFRRLPRNAVTNERIRGISCWLLELAAIEHGYQSPFWATRETWESLGGQVDESAGITTVNRLQLLPGEYPLYSSGCLYNREVVEIEYTEPTCRVLEPQSVVDTSGARIRYGPRACYHRLVSGYEYITMPSQESYSDLETYWSDHFHELIHWASLSPSRLAWEGKNREQWELIADLGSALLMDQCGCVTKQILVPAIVKAWTEQIGLGVGYLIDACDHAEDAVDYIIELTQRGDHD